MPAWRRRFSFDSKLSVGCVRHAGAPDSHAD